MQVEQRDPRTLIPHPRNSRKHSSGQIAALAEAMTQFGFTQPVVVDKAGVILIGHARTEAAILAEMATIPVVVRSDLTEVSARALIMADNRLHEFGAGWDDDILGEELRDLMAGGIDITVTGFDAPEPVAKTGKSDEDATPEPPETPITQPGDVWHLGRHRLFCGDSTDPALLAACMTFKPVAMITDPPYGVEYDPAWRNRALREDGSPVGARAVGEVMNDDKADWREVWAGFTGKAAYVWHAGTKAHVVHDSLLAAGFDVKAQIVWAKGRASISRGHYHVQHEPCFYAVRKGAKPKWRGPALSTVWEISHTKSFTGHGTQKPVEAARRPMLTCTEPGDVVFEPFSGSGTTLLAAEMIGRTCVAIELSPAYADVAAKRWSNWTGKKPVLMRQGVEVPLGASSPPSAGAGVVEIA